MFVDVGGDLSVGFTYIAGAVACTQKLINNSRSQALRDRILDPKQTPFILFFAYILNVSACVTYILIL